LLWNHRNLGNCFASANYAVTGGLVPPRGRHVFCGAGENLHEIVQKKVRMEGEEQRSRAGHVRSGERRARAGDQLASGSEGDATSTEHIGGTLLIFIEQEER